MKKAISIILVLCFSLTLFSCDKKSNNKTTEEKDNNYKLVFSDEFDKNEIDSSIWSNEIGFIRNNEPQYYTDRKDNAEVKDGNLVITCKAEDFTADDGTTAKYTSASLNTSKSKSFTYGKIEMKAKLPETTSKACWPAFWMLGTSVNTIGWPKCGEVDIMESYGTDTSKYYTNVQWADESDTADEFRNIMKLGNTISKEVDGNLSDDYHIYGIEWTKEKMSFYFDDEFIGSADISDSTQSELHEPMYLLINLALTQEGDTSPLDNGEILKYYIDYVRVYQK